MEPLRDALKGARPDWSIAELSKVLAKLSRVGIFSTELLAESLTCESSFGLNEKLRCNGEKEFARSTLQALRDYLDIEHSVQAGAGLKHDRPEPQPQDRGVPGEAVKDVACIENINGGRSKADVGERPKEEDVRHRNGFTAAAGRNGFTAIAGAQRRGSGLASATASARHDSGNGVSSAPGRPTASEPSEASGVSHEHARLARERGIDLSLLEHPEQVPSLLDRLEKLQNLTASKLQAEYAELGYATDELMSRTECRELLEEALVLERMSLSGLQSKCRERQLEFDSGQSRKDLLQLLTDATWEAQGVPMSRLAGVADARRVLGNITNLANLSVHQLVAMSKAMQLPTGADQATLIDQLTQAYIWDALPDQELRRECRSYGISPDDAPRDKLRTCLRKTFIEGRAKARGIPVDSLDESVCEKLLKQVDALQTKSIYSLRSECKKMGVRCSPHLDIQALADRLRDVLVWRQLPVRHLSSMCAERGLETTGSRAALTERILLQEDERAELEAQGIPLSRLSAQQVQVVLPLLRSEYSEIDEQSTEDLSKWYTSMLSQEDLGMTRDGLVKLSKLVTFWNALPEEDLRRLCEEDMIEVRAGSSEGEPDLCIQKLLERELMNMWEARGFPAARIGRFDRTVEAVTEYERIRQMSDEELTRTYKDSHLPEAEGMGREDRLNTLKSLMIWEMLPLAELRADCLRVGPLPAENASDTDDDRRSDMVQQLLVDMFKSSLKEKGVPSDRLGGTQALQLIDKFEEVNQMSLKQLVEWYTEMGFPGASGFDKSELLELWKQVQLWRSLTLQELKKETAQRKLSNLSMPRHDDEESQQVDLCNELLEDELMSLWDKKGFEARRIGNIDTVIRAVSTYDNFSSMPDEELIKSAYGAYGFEPEANVKREKLLRNLKTLVVWELLPVPDLQKYCLECKPPIHAATNLGSDEDRRNDLLQQLLVDMFEGSYELKGIPVKRLASRRDIAHVNLCIESYSAMSLDELRGEYEATGCTAHAGMTKDELAARMKDIAIWQGLSTRELINEYCARGLDAELRDHLLSGLVMKANVVREQAPTAPQPGRSLGPSDAAAGGRGGPVNPKLAQGMCLYINLARRPDRRRALEKICSAHAWLATMMRIDAVDGESLSWQKLIVDKLFTRDACVRAKNGEKDALPTIGPTPEECSAQLLTRGACGCAMSHRLAWQALVDSGKPWALILEDDVTEVCTNFDSELARVLQCLPAGWKMCYLGYHTGQLLAKGTSFKGPLRELPRAQWLAGLYGYLISKALAKKLLEEASPMDAQVDTVVGLFVAKERGGLAVPDRQFLLYSPPTEKSRDTDIQRFQDN